MKVGGVQQKSVPELLGWSSNMLALMRKDWWGLSR
jgi:hypothetical protein